MPPPSLWKAREAFLVDGPIYIGFVYVSPPSAATPQAVPRSSNIGTASKLAQRVLLAWLFTVKEQSASAAARTTLEREGRGGGGYSIGDIYSISCAAVVV